MIRILIPMLILATSLSAWSQSLYAYRDNQDKLVITDRKLRDKNLKLVKVFKSERKKAAEAAPSDQAPIDRVRGGKYVLTKRQIHGLAGPIAKAQGVDPELVYAVIQIESSRDMRALSSKGAMGLMQLIPATAERFGVKNAWDPRQNVRGGVAYLRYLLSYFEGDVDLVLAAYNAGENAVDRHGGIPPYKETQRYVKKIRKLYTKETVAFDETAARGRSRLVAQKTKGVESRLASAE